MEARGQPACTGYVVGFNLDPNDPTRIDWKVKILTGPHTGSKATIDRDRVPRGIRRGQDVRLEVVNVDGNLVATYVAIVDQQAR